MGNESQYIKTVGEQSAIETPGATIVKFPRPGMINDLIQRIANAIFRQEGNSPAHPNPGNLRDCPWFPRVVSNQPRQYPSDGGPTQFVQYAGGFWIPRSRAEGMAGAAHVISLHLAEGDSLRKLIGIWAPASDNNNTEAYIANVAKWASIPNTELPLWNFIQDSAPAEKLT